MMPVRARLNADAVQAMPLPFSDGVDTIRIEG